MSDSGEISYLNILKKLILVRRIEQKIQEIYSTDLIKSPVHLSLGQEFGVDLFEIGDSINITGFTIGKGNTSKFKLHGHHTGLMSHGGKSKRLQGSMGSGTTPGRVFKGQEMPRRSGMEKRTIKGLKIVDIDKSQNLIVVKGSIPGKPGNLVSMRSGI